MKTRIRVGSLVVVCAVSFWSLPALAQFGPPLTQEAAQQMEAKGYSPPRIASEQIEKLAKQPDFQGEWNVTAPISGGALGVVFDPFNVSIPYDVNAGLFGPTPGIYMTKIPYNDEYRKKYKEIIADAVAGRSHDTYALCIPYGMPRFMGGAAVGFDVLQNADVMSMQNWYDNEQRRIFLDGRPHPTMDPMGGDNPRTRTGHSVGHWQGDTLVVDTVNMIAGVLDDTEAPYSDQLHLTERIRLIAPNILADEMTLEDPIAFTETWTVTRYYSRRPPPPVEMSADGQPLPPKAASLFSPPPLVHNLADRVCHETIDMSKGFQSLILPQEIDARGKKKKQHSPTSESR